MCLHVPVYTNNTSHGSTQEDLKQKNKMYSLYCYYQTIDKGNTTVTYSLIICVARGITEIADNN